MGVNTTLYKVLAFALSGVFTALAGGIHAYWITFLDPESAFDISLNVKMIIMAVFGGPGTVLGPVLGAFVLSAVSEVLSSKVTNLAGLFFGVVVVAAVVLMPRGVADVVRQFRRIRLALFRRKSASAPDMSAILEVKTCHPPLRRTGGRQRRQLHARQRRDSRRDRPERRRQDHPGQPDQRHAAADLG